MHPTAFATTLGHRGDARQLLQGGGVWVALPIASPSHQHAWAQHGAGSGETVKHGIVRVLAIELRDLLLEALDRQPQTAQLTDQDFDPQNRGFNHRRILGQGLRRAICSSRCSKAGPADHPCSR